MILLTIKGIDSFLRVLISLYSLYIFYFIEIKDLNLLNLTLALIFIYFVMYVVVKKAIFRKSLGIEIISKGVMK